MYIYLFLNLLFIISGSQYAHLLTHPVLVNLVAQPRTFSCIYTFIMNNFFVLKWSKTHSLTLIIFFDF